MKLLKIDIEQEYLNEKALKKFSKKHQQNNRRPRYIGYSSEQNIDINTDNLHTSVKPLLSLEFMDSVEYNNKYLKEAKGKWSNIKIKNLKKA